MLTSGDTVRPVRPVLVVDDDAHIRALLAVVLGDEGYAVVTAQNGKVALERVE